MIFTSDTTEISPVDPTTLPNRGILILTARRSPAWCRVGTWEIEGINLVGRLYVTYTLPSKDLKNIRSKAYRFYQQCLKDPKRYRKMPRALTGGLLVFRDTKQKVVVLNFKNPRQAQIEAQMSKDHAVVVPPHILPEKSP